MTSSALFFIFKAVLSGLLVAVISTIAKSLPKWAAFLTALPIITFLSMIWIYLESKDLPLLEAYVLDVLLWTLPGLLFFIAAIFLFRAQVPFVFTLLGASLVMGVALFFFNKLNLFKT